MLRILIAIGLFLFVCINGAFFLLEKSAEAPATEVVADEEAPLYDELSKGPVLYSSDVPGSVLQMGRVEDMPVASSDTLAKKRSKKPAIPRPKADIVIRDNYFVGMITDLTTNMHDYDGKTVQYEGFVRNIDPEFNAKESFAVCRMFYCCGNDAYFVGLPCYGYTGTIPKDDEWVVVTGVMGIREDPEGEYPYLKVTEMTLLPEPGEAYVYQ